MRAGSYIESTLPSDDELQQFTNYVSGYLSEAEEQAFDDRLADDDAFFDRMAPMFKVWYAPPPSVIEAGEQLKVRLAEQQGRVVDTRRPVSLWVRRRMIAAVSLAAAGMIFGARLELPQHQEIPLVAKGPSASKPASGANLAPQAPTGTVVAVEPRHGHAATQPKQIVVLTPLPIDTATERAVAVLAAAPLPAAAVTGSSLQVGAMPVSPFIAVPPLPREVAMLDTSRVASPATPTKVDTTRIDAQGTQVTKREPVTRSSGLFNWLRRHLPW
jgi:hypothetical protein